MNENTPQPGKVACCAGIYAQHATFTESGATTRATDAQQTGLKALSLLVLQRNKTRNSSATTPEKPRNFDPQKTGEKLRGVAPLDGYVETDPQALAYYLERAQELPLPRNEKAEDDRVTCQGCQHFHPDPINPPAGIGTCAVGAGRTGPCLWPMARRWCGSFEGAR